MWKGHHGLKEKENFKKRDIMKQQGKSLGKLYIVRNRNKTLPPFEQYITESEITKIGRKYIYTPHGQYDSESLVEKSEFSPNKAFKTMQEAVEYLEYPYLEQKIKRKMEVWNTGDKLTIHQLREINKIIEGDTNK